MNMQLEVVIAVLAGVVLGITGTLAVSWLKSPASRPTAKKQTDLVKAKRAYRRKTECASENKSASSATSPLALKKKLHGRKSKEKAAADIIQSSAKVISGPKKRRGRPTNAELAARQATTDSLVEKNSEYGNALTNDPVQAERQMLLDKLLNLSPAQIHGLAAMPVGETSPAISKDGLIM
jgi:hypothetical protein